MACKTLGLVPAAAFHQKGVAEPLRMTTEVVKRAATSVSTSPIKNRATFIFPTWEHNWAARRFAIRQNCLALGLTIASVARARADANRKFGMPARARWLKQSLRLNHG